MKNVTLPNGMHIKALNTLEPDVLYHEIFTTGTYLKHGLTVRDGDCIFDVGANIGLFPLYLAQRFKNVAVHSFEPVPDVYEVLKENIKNPENGAVLKAWNLGLSNAEQTVEFKFSTAFSMTGSMYSGEVDSVSQKSAGIYAWMRALLADMERIGKLSPALNKTFQKLLLKKVVRVGALGVISLPLIALLFKIIFTTKKVQCRLTTVSQFLKEQNIDKIDLLKIDVEGAEWDVLQGVENSDWSKIHQLLLEVHDIDGRVVKIENFLKGRGFTIVCDQEDWELHKLMNIYTVYARRV
jgi:hypothetical protein